MAILNSWNLVEVTVNQGRAVDHVTGPDPIVIELTRI
jgi:hypothetical protein